jgi:hypothetical protein
VGPRAVLDVMAKTRLRAGRPTDILFPTRTFYLRHRVQIGSGVYPASYPMGNGGYFPRGKAAGVWSLCSHPSSAEVENVWSYTSNPPMSSWRGASLSKGTNLLSIHDHQW